MKYNMEQIKYIKSFSRGQITIPKEIREILGVPEEFWMKIFIDDGKVILEPERTIKSRDDYLKSLVSMKTDWFSDEDQSDYGRIRDEMDDHVSKNSL
jgi:AbrB family looped-hinge helix DNA binding protein